jgi:putative polyketide hydroxylase
LSQPIIIRRIRKRFVHGCGQWNVGIELQCRLIGSPKENSGPGPAGSALDLPIETITAGPVGRAVLDALMPQVMGHANHETFKTIRLRQLQPLSRGQITDQALASVESGLATVLNHATSVDPVDPEAFLKAYGIGPEGASLIRPDGYVAWRAVEFPSNPVRELTDVFRRVSFATSSKVI